MMLARALIRAVRPSVLGPAPRLVAAPSTVARRFHGSTLLRLPTSKDARSTSPSPSLSPSSTSPEQRASRSVKVKPLPRSTADSLSDLFRPSPPALAFNGLYFAMALKPVPAKLMARMREGPIVPPWLPQPASPATHEARHLIADPRAQPISQAAAAGSTSGGTGGDEARWESDPRTVKPPPPPPASTVYAIVFTSKKRLHKLAVIRHRCRTKLMAALTSAIKARASGGLDSRFAPTDGVWVIHAHPQSYSCPMDTLTAEMDRALARIGRHAFSDGTASGRFPERRSSGHGHGHGSTSTGPRTRVSRTTTTAIDATANVGASSRRDPTLPRSRSSGRPSSSSSSSSSPPPPKRYTRAGFL